LILNYKNNNSTKWLNGWRFQINIYFIFDGTFKNQVKKSSVSHFTEQNEMKISKKEEERIRPIRIKLGLIIMQY